MISARRFALHGLAAVLLAAAPSAWLGAQRAPTPTVRLLLLGQSLIEHDPRGRLDAPLATLLPSLSAADIVFTNFEGAVKGAGCVCTPTRGDVFQHGSTPEIFDFLRFARVNLLSLANNHAWDYGTDGVAFTLDAARARGLKTAGTGRTMAEATAPAIIEVHGVRVAMVAMATVRLSDSAAATSTAAGVNLLRLDNVEDWERNLTAIREAKRHADVVIVYHHFQTVGTPAWQRRWAHAAIDAGGSVYVAHGEPTLAGVESYRGRPMLYGLGNLIFQTRTEIGHYPRDVWESVLAELTIGRDTVSDVRLTPIVLDEGSAGPTFLETRGFPRLATPAEGRPILARLARMSMADGTTLRVEDGAATLVIPR